MNTALRRGFAFAGAVLFLCASMLCFASAHSVITPAEQMQTHWNTDNGFPSETVRDITMTADGLLWFATADGLIRYDGYAFSVINKQTEPTFPAMGTSALCAAPNGDLWVGTNGNGVLHLADGVLRNITTQNGALSDAVVDINLLPDGSAAVAVPTGVYFVRADGSVGDCFALSDRALVVRDIAVGAAGNVFGVTEEGTLFSIVDGGFSFSTFQKYKWKKEGTYTAIDSAGERFLVGCADGSLIIVEKDENGEYVPHLAQTELSTVSRISHDAENNFHIISQDGWGILFADGTYACMQKSGVEGLSAFCCDFQGNFWLGTRQNGAVKISKTDCRNWNVLHELPSFSALSFLLYDTYACVGTTEGLWMLDTRTDARVENALTRATAGQSVQYLLADRNGVLWAAAGTTLYQLQKTGELQTFSAQNGLPAYTIRVLSELENGDIAVGTDNGLCLLRENRVLHTLDAAAGMLGRVSALLQVPDGTLLVGTVGNGVYSITKDGCVQAYDTDAALPAGKVACMVRDPSAADRIWFSIGSELLYRDGAHTAMRFSGLNLTGDITDLFFTDEALWVITTNAAAVVRKADMFTRSDTLPYETVGKRQGILAALDGDAQNFADENGVLYLCTGNGVNQIDTKTYQSYTPIPRILFYTAQSGKNTVALRDGITVPGTENAVQLCFTAITFGSTADFCLEYKLEGVDAEYTRVTPASEIRVNYNHLPYGTYTFSVRAVDKNGALLGESTSVTFQKAASSNDRVVFWLMVIAMAAIVVGGGVLFGMMIRNAVLKRRQKRYRDITRQSISAIVNAVDAKDPYTRGHSDRVAKYAAEIARRYGLKPLKVSDIYYSALLHDIGKIGIPDDILKKPGKLTKEEYEIIKTHAAIGADIVKDISAIPHIRRGIHDHHERYDGNGYPRGLRGNSISLEGRIIGMADAYDAMASARGYSAPHTKDYITAEIREGRGKQFDPKIADIVLQMMEEGFFETFAAQSEETASDAPPETPPTA